MSKKKGVENQKVQLYAIEVITKEDGHMIINRTNDGFSLFELMGIISKVQDDLFHCFDDAAPKFDETNKVVK